MTGCLAFNIRDNYNRQSLRCFRGVYLGDTLLEKMLEHEVIDYVLSLSRDNFVRPRNAYLDSSTGVISGVYGKRLTFRQQ